MYYSVFCDDSYEEGVRTTSAQTDSEVTTASVSEVKKMSRSEKTRRSLIIIATVILVIFLVYLLLILIYPSMNIGMNP